MMLIRSVCNFQGSVAYARALCKINLLSQEEMQDMIMAFKQVFYKIYIAKDS